MKDTEFGIKWTRHDEGSPTPPTYHANIEGHRAFIVRRPYGFFSSVFIAGTLYQKAKNQDFASAEKWILDKIRESRADVSPVEWTPKGPNTNHQSATYLGCSLVVGADGFGTGYVFHVTGPGVAVSGSAEDLEHAKQLAMHCARRYPPLALLRGEWRVHRNGEGFPAEMSAVGRVDARMAELVIFDDPGGVKARAVVRAMNGYSGMLAVLREAEAALTAASAYIISEAHDPDVARTLGPTLHAAHEVVKTALIRSAKEI